MSPQSPGAEDYLGDHCAQLQLSALRTADDSLEQLLSANRRRNNSLLSLSSSQGLGGVLYCVCRTLVGSVSLSALRLVRILM